jgi:mannosylglucosylglycerate synthase
MHVPPRMSPSSADRRTGSEQPRPLVALLSFRLGEADGVSVTAGHWAAAFSMLGFDVRTVAGSGVADRLVPGLGIEAPNPPSFRALASAVIDADLVVVENVCSLPMNPPATETVATVLRGRPAILHHHDLAWQREWFADVPGWPPDDPCWVHVVINERSRRELAERGIEATTVYHGFATAGAPGRRAMTRWRLAVDDGDLLVLQPTRAIARKNVAGGIAFAEAMGATYWLTGPAEDGYHAELRTILDRARCPVRRHLPSGLAMADAYAAADVVVLPSIWEGFGAALIESALHRRPLAVANYPVLDEIARFGFRWFPIGDPEAVRAWLEHPDRGLIEHNSSLARRHFSLEALAARLASVLRDADWLPDPICRPALPPRRR